MSRQTEQQACQPRHRLATPLKSLRGWRDCCLPAHERSGARSNGGWLRSAVGLAGRRAACCFPPAPGRRSGGAGVPARNCEAWAGRVWKGRGWRRGTTTIKAGGTLESQRALVRPTGVPRRHAPGVAEGVSNCGAGGRRMWRVSRIQKRSSEARSQG